MYDVAFSGDKQHTKTPGLNHSARTREYDWHRPEKRWWTASNPPITSALLLLHLLAHTLEEVL